MSWFSDLFSNSVGEVIDSVGGIIDDLNTSGEEKLAAKERMTALLQSHEQKIMETTLQFEKEITERHANDMKSDSWLSKNIRPMGLIFALVNLFLIAWASIFSTLSDSQIGLAQVWIPLLVGMVGAMVAFYYSWRGAEKITKMRGK